MRIHRSNKGAELMNFIAAIIAGLMAFLIVGLWYYVSFGKACIDNNTELETSSRARYYYLYILNTKNAITRSISTVLTTL